MVYSVGTQYDSGSDNYIKTINQKGDAVYETSANYRLANEWYSDYLDLPANSGPIFIRGGFHGNKSMGMFSFYYARHPSEQGFRSVLIVGAGL